MVRKSKDLRAGLSGVFIMSDLTYVALFRKIEDSFVYQDSGLLHLWIHCLIKASFKDRTIMFDGTQITLKKGQFITGRRSLAKSLKTTEQRVRSRLALLEKNNKIIQKSTNKYTIITVVKYEYYQGDPKKITSRQPADNQQITTNNKVNKENNNSEQGSVGIKDMGWNKYGDEHEEGVVDFDSGEMSNPEEEAQAEERELNKKIRHNLTLVEDIRGLAFGKGKDMNYHVKIYRSLLENGWSHKRLIEEFIEIINTDHWKEKRKVGQYPGMNTLQFHLRNQQPS